MQLKHIYQLNCYYTTHSEKYHLLYDV